MQRINHELVMMDREKAGRDIKSCAPRGRRGYDAGKKINSRKRHIAVDSNERLLGVKVTPANVQDQAGGIPLVKRLVRSWPWTSWTVVTRTPSSTP